ncbi:DUF2252 domain-containing protein [Runella sp.]|uniref:DUF2252 domain-containing protein n=1 Tax=Runella sp. TaxID=1960881 RepID=UPI003D12ED68
MTASEQIKQFNAGRDALLLAHKYERMTEDLYRFFRATSHLFYDDFAQHFSTADSSRVWGCGDLHLQNFGTYKAENRLVYFDLNDFDEAMLLPVTWELSRMLVSIHLAAEELDLEESESTIIINAFLDSYTKTLSSGKPIDIERRTTTGMLQQFMEKLEKRRRKDFIKERTIKIDNDRKLKIDDEKVLSIAPKKRAEVEKMVMAWQQQHPNPFFKKICDVGIRVTGTASLGLERYVLLVESMNEKSYLLDLKEARQSVLNSYIHLPQPVRASEAERIVIIQQRVNNVLPTLLNVVEGESKSYVLKELQPEQDKFDFHEWDGELESLEALIRTMGTLTASGHLRSSGRQGSSIADQLIDFAQETQWQNDLKAYCQAYPTKVHQDYFDFCEAYDEGFFIG